MNFPKADCAGASSIGASARLARTARITKRSRRMARTKPRPSQTTDETDQSQMMRLNDNASSFGFVDRTTRSIAVIPSGDRFLDPDATHYPRPRGRAIIFCGLGCRDGIVEGGRNRGRLVGRFPLATLTCCPDARIAAISTAHEADRLQIADLTGIIIR